MYSHKQYISPLQLRIVLIMRHHSFQSFISQHMVTSKQMSSCTTSSSHKQHASQQWWKFQCVRFVFGVVKKVRLCTFPSLVMFLSSFVFNFSLAPFLWGSTLWGDSSILKLNSYRPCTWPSPIGPIPSIPKPSPSIFVSTSRLYNTIRHLTHGMSYNSKRFIHLISWYYLYYGIYLNFHKYIS